MVNKDVFDALLLLLGDSSIEIPDIEQIRAISKVNKASKEERERNREIAVITAKVRARAMAGYFDLGELVTISFSENLNALVESGYTVEEVEVVIKECECKHPCKNDKHKHPFDERKGEHKLPDKGRPCHGHKEEIDECKCEKETKIMYSISWNAETVPDGDLKPDDEDTNNPELPPSEEDPKVPEPDDEEDV